MSELQINELEVAELPGGELIAQGVADLERGKITVESVLVSIAWDSLKRKGMPLSRRLDLDQDAELVLYDLLRAEDQGDAYSKYNALIRRLVSFQRAFSVVARRAAG